MNIYQNFMDLLNTYVFGGTMVAGSNQELIATLVATCGTLFIISVPFMIVWKFIKMIMGA